MFCASILPEFLTGIVSNIITWIFTAIFGFVAALGISSYGYYGYYSRPSGLEAIITGGGITLILFLMIVAFVTVFLTVFGKMLKYRAVGYWAARHASEWSDEDTDHGRHWCCTRACTCSGTCPCTRACTCSGTCPCTRTDARGDACGARLGCRCHAGG